MDIIISYSLAVGKEMVGVCSRRDCDGCRKQNSLARTPVPGAFARLWIFSWTFFTSLRSAVLFESLIRQKEKPHRMVWLSFLAEDEGFEPPQTESESGVLPLHKSSKNDVIIRSFSKLSSVFKKYFYSQGNFSPFSSRRR